MLIAAALLTTWGLPALFVEMPDPPARSEIPLQAFAHLELLLLHGVKSLNDPDFIALAQWSQTRSSHAMNQHLLLLTASVSFLLTHLTVGLILLLDGRKKIRRQTSILPLEQVPLLAAVLHAQLQRLEIHRYPELRQGPGWLDGEAHGNRMEAIIILRGPWLEKIQNPYHQVTLLHELAHIYHGDSQPRELARVLWLVAAISSLSALVFLPYFGTDGLSWPTVFRLLLPFVLGSLVWSELVRDREFFADSRVAEWGYRDLLRKRLTLPESFGQPSKKHLGWFPGLVSRWKLLLGKHPSNGQRRAYLEDPSHLFSNLSLRQAAASGLATGLIGCQLATVAELCFLAAGLVSTVLAFFLPPLPAITIGFHAVFGLLTFIVIYFLTAHLGRQTLRLAVADQTAGYPVVYRFLKLLATAATYTLAVEVALWIFGEPLQNSLARKLGLGWLILVTIFVWLWLIQNYIAGRRVLGIQNQESTAIRLLTAIQIFSTLQLTLLAIPALVYRVLIAVLNKTESVSLLDDQGKGPGPILVILAFLTSIAVLPALVGWLVGTIALWAAAHFWSRRRIAHCQTCGHQPVNLGKTGLLCPHCGSPFASWLFTQAGRSER